VNNVQGGIDAALSELRSLVLEPPPPLLLPPPAQEQASATAARRSCPVCGLVACVLVGLVVLAAVYLLGRAASR